MGTEVQQASVTLRLDALREAHEAASAAAVAQLVHLVALAEAYRVDEEQLWRPFAERYVQVGADGTPTVGEFLVAEVAGVLACSLDSARGRLAEALDLAYRHPRLWEAVLSGRVPAWQAIVVARATSRHGLDAAAADWVDRQAAISLAQNPLGIALRRVESWVLMADPALAAERADERAKARFVSVSSIEDQHVTLWGQLDAGDGLALDAALDQTAEALAAGGLGATHDVLRSVALGLLAKAALGEQTLPGLCPAVASTGAPSAGPTAEASPTRRAVITIHLRPQSALGGEPGPDGYAVASIDGWGEVLTERLGTILAGVPVTVRPVIDLNAVTPVDSYAIPERMREAVCTRNPVEVFPYGTRRSTRCDLDHRVPYEPGVSGQTRVENLGPLSRFAHRVKTFGGWRLEQPAPGIFVWTSPAGFRYRVTPFGTIMIGRPAHMTVRSCGGGYGVAGGFGLDGCRSGAPPGERLSRGGWPGRLDPIRRGIRALYGFDEEPDEPRENVDGWMSPTDAWAALAGSPGS